MQTYQVEIPGRGTFEVQSETELTDSQVYQIALEQATPQMEYGFGRAALQGLTMGFSDEAEAQLRASRGEGRYEDILAGIRQAKQRFEEEYPIGSTMAEIGGSVPTMLAGGLGAARLASRVPEIARRMSPLTTGITGATATGGLTGAVTGAGQAEPGQRMAGAAVGGAVGTALGPAGQVATSVGGRAVSRGLEVGKSTLGLDATKQFQRRADEKLLQALRRDGLSPQDAANRLQTIQASGYKPETIVEAGGKNTRALADLVSKYPGASQLAEELAEERMAGQAGRVISDFERVFGRRESALDVADDVIRRRDVASAPLYKQAYQEGGVISDPRIDDLMKLSSFKDAYKTARELAEFDGVNLPANVDDLKRMGGFDLRTLDYIKRGLDDVLFVKASPLAGTGKQVVGRLKEKRREFVDILDEVGPPSYRQARQAFAGPTEVREAIEAGQQFTRLSPNQLERDFAKLTPAEKEGFQLGVLESVRTNIEKGADGSDVLRKVWASPEKRKQLQIILGNEQFRDLSNSLAREKIIRRTDVTMTRGSQTMERQLLQREFEGTDELIPLMRQRGPISGTGEYLLRTMTGPGQPTAEALAPTLFSTDMQRQLQELTRLQSLDELLRRQAAVRGGAVGAATGTQAGLLGE
jgi:hypothetical protein